MSQHPQRPSHPTAQYPTSQPQFNLLSSPPHSMSMSNSSSNDFYARRAPPPGFVEMSPPRAMGPAGSGMVQGQVIMTSSGPQSGPPPPQSFPGGPNPQFARFSAGIQGQASPQGLRIQHPTLVGGVQGGPFSPPGAMQQGAHQPGYGTYVTIPGQQQLQMVRTGPIQQGNGSNQPISVAGGGAPYQIIQPGLTVSQSNQPQTMTIYSSNADISLQNQPQLMNVKQDPSTSIPEMSQSSAGGPVSNLSTNPRTPTDSFTNNPSSVPNLSGNPPTASHQSSSKILTKKALEDLTQEVDPAEQLDEDVKDALLQMTDDFLDRVVDEACRLAKHRKSNVLETKDLKYVLEKNHNMWIPGFSSEDARPPKKACATDAHKQRMMLIKKTLKKV